MQMQLVMKKKRRKNQKKKKKPSSTLTSFLSHSSLFLLNEMPPTKRKVTAEAEKVDDGSESFHVVDNSDDEFVATPKAKAARKATSSSASGKTSSSSSSAAAADAKVKAALDAKVAKKVAATGHSGKNKPYTEVVQGMTREQFDAFFGHLGTASSQGKALHRRVAKDADEIAHAFNITLPIRARYNGFAYVRVGCSGPLFTDVTFESLQLKHEAKTNTVTLKFRTVELPRTSWKQLPSLQQHKARLGHL
jgi:hypothetical protein